MNMNVRISQSSEGMERLGPILAVFGLATQQKFEVFKAQATRAKELVDLGLLTRQFVADRFSQIAGNKGLTDEVGLDEVQNVLGEIFRAHPVQICSGLDMVRMSDVVPAEIEFLWPGRLARGKAHTLAGAGGLGKSTLLYGLAACASTGDKWPDGADGCEPGDVIVLSSEDDIADTIAPRLIAAGADMSRVFVVRSVQDEDGRRSFNLQIDLARLELEIKRLPNVVMVILDPITSYLGPVDSHRNAEVRAVLDPLNEFASRTRTVLLANNHFSKAAGPANARILGSVAFVNASRAAFIVTADEQDETRRLFIPSKSNIGPLGTGLAYRIEGCLIDHAGKSIPTSRIMWESAPVTISADAALAAAEGSASGGQSSRGEAEDFLRDMLAAGPMPAKEVKAEATEAGITAKALRTAREKLVEVQKSGMHGGWVWALRRCPNGGEDAQGAYFRNGASSAPSGHLPGGDND